MDTSRMTTRLVGAALAALALLPATAQAAALDPLKPCYISVTQGGSPHADHARVARPRRQRLHGRLADRRGLQRQARPHDPGRRRRQPAAPDPAVALPGEGSGHVHADRRRARQPGQHGRAAVTHHRADAQAQAQAGPARRSASASGARASRRRRRCGRTTSTRARSARPSGWSSGSRTPAGRSRSSASRSRSSARSWACWRLQVDQQKRYSRAPDGVNVRADIKVQKVFT